MKKRWPVFLIVVVAALAAFAEDVGVPPANVGEASTVFEQTGPVAFWDTEGNIILGVRRTEADELIVEIGDEKQIAAIYDESGEDLLARQGPLRGWEWIAITWAFFIGLVLGGL